MEPLRKYRKKGPVIQAWGPFRVRAPTIIVTEGHPDMPMPFYPLSVMLSPECEETIGPLNSEDVTLQGLVKLVRYTLRVLEHTIAVWDQHLREYEQPERMAALQAQLDEEARAREREADAEQLSRTVPKEERPLAAQVLENQHNERQRLRSLYAAIQAGLRDLEAEFPELDTGAESS